MRLDHLLSREPVLGEQAACWPFGWCVGCFLVPACVYCPDCGWWVWVRFWVGHKKVIRADTLSGSRSTPCERPPPVGGGCLRSQLAVVVLLVWVVCGGLFVICIVVASIFVLYCFLCFV